MAENDFKDRMYIAAKLAGNATELARRSGISRRAIGTYLSGASDPTRERLIAIAKASGVSVEWLATGKSGVMQSEAQAAVRLEDAESLEQTALGIQDIDDLPIPYYVIPSEHFSSVDLLGLQNTGALYINSNSLKKLNFINFFNLRAINIVGNRVTPLGVGNTLLVDCGGDVMKDQEAGVYLFQKNGGIQVSVAYPYEAKYIRIISHQEHDTTEILDPNRSDITVLGRVIWSCGKV